MPWLLPVALLATMVVILAVKSQMLRKTTRQPLSRSSALGAGIAGFSPLIGMINQRYLRGTAHNIGLAIQGLMIGIALCLIWKGSREIRAGQ